MSKAMSIILTKTFQLLASRQVLHVYWNNPMTFSFNSILHQAFEIITNKRKNQKTNKLVAQKLPSSELKITKLR